MSLVERDPFFDSLINFQHLSCRLDNPPTSALVQKFSYPLVLLFGVVGSVVVCRRG